MAIFIIFWCAVLGIVLWFFSIILKGLQSVIYGSYDAIVEWGAITLLAGIVLVFFYMLYGLSSAIRTGNFWDIVGGLILSFVGIALVIGLVGSLGALILELAVMAIATIITVVITVLELLNSWIEEGYVFFLKKIKQKVDML